MSEIPKGYKQTEIGIIPEDWEVKKLGEVFEISAGGDLNKNKFSETKTSKHKYPIYSNAVENEGLYGYSTDYKYPESCITVTARGTLGYAIPRYEKFNAIIRLLVLQSKKELNIKYVAEYINNMINFSIESTGVPQLTAPQISKYKLLLPPLPEQQAIAKVLSDIDKLIESIDKLIEKKKLIKKGVMQQLLTGKKRLPGFKGEWVRKKLGEVGNITGAGVDKKINKNEELVRLLNYMDVYKKDFLYDKEINYWTTAPKSKIEQCSVKKGDVFFTPSSELQTDIAHSAVAMDDMDNVVYSYHIIRLRLKENWDLKFRTYIFKTRNFLEPAEKMAEGSGKRYVISLKNFRELEIFYPSNIKEQQAIAKILSDMDAEIEALQKKKQKYEQIKKGAMQQLLTGKIRLKF